MSVTIYLPNLPEYLPIAEAAQGDDSLRVDKPASGSSAYIQISADGEIHFDRKLAGIEPALWYSLLCGGFRGAITEFGRNDLCVVSEDPVSGAQVSGGQAAREKQE